MNEALVPNCSMGGTGKDGQYFVVLKEFLADKKKIPKGSVVRKIKEHYVVLDLNKPLMNLSHEKAKYLKEISKDDAEMLFEISEPFQRYELFQNEKLFKSIARIKIHDIVQLKPPKGPLMGIVKNVKGSEKSHELLTGLLFEVEILPEDRKTRQKGKVINVDAGDILIAHNADEGESESMNENYTKLHCDGKSGPFLTENEELDLEVGSMVQVKWLNGATVYGVIRWIGVPKGLKCDFAGIEMDYGLNEGTDGTLHKERYFSCDQYKAIFVELTNCKPDARFLTRTPTKKPTTPQHVPPEARIFGEEMTINEDVPPVREDEALRLMKGRMKGIQGHYNSCYLDATIFSLFTFTPVLDSILHMPLKQEHEVNIQRTLREGIINPLRKTGVVNSDKVMKLRMLLGNHTFTSDEKDPEEFISVLLHEILAIDPLLKIRSDQKVQESNCYQIILEKDEELKVPSVQLLLERSFISCGLKFEEIPSCLLIQMPRFGKEFKMFPKIRPSLELDITDLLSNTLRHCFICGGLAEYECDQCLLDPIFKQGLIKQYCNICNMQVHSHIKRKEHQIRKFPSPNNFSVKPPFPRHKMELFAVLCIETSHYVSFVKYGPGKRSWVFFDSMADRIDNENIPEITDCPQVGDYLMIPEDELLHTDLKQLDGLAKRLFCDAYMCMYQSPKMCLYN
ncbi:ubiquitin carboxyl-terminal hydrolase CYLD [Callorhinchus milii]|uniref:Ubiquitin carboxyl-terminal hydrolase CYLD n=1 Tax=Callorhinchus milii TaxID=7868 RepID=A0A4W3K300_CALMI|nr:ubiquitin carboxyl-terminal hydrolase CYLD [Callorhinchus milii]|eukprot:gi/632973951/ref/XP_007903402.1/ PREDICTED: ubiquitin carboxyl-terminal hydrolase CYLD-like [Callorhinchus milii]